MASYSSFREEFFCVYISEDCIYSVNKKVYIFCGNRFTGRVKIAYLQEQTIIIDTFTFFKDFRARLTAGKKFFKKNLKRMEKD
jgi:tRNA uridine 5-carbamoylmethylation protein Kti12